MRPLPVGSRAFWSNGTAICPFVVRSLNEPSYARCRLAAARALLVRARRVSRASSGDCGNASVSGAFDVCAETMKESPAAPGEAEARLMLESRTLQDVINNVR